MEWWQVVLIVIGSAALSLAVAAFLIWRTLTGTTRRLAARVQRLPWRAKLELAKAMLSDERVPLPVRAIPLVLIAYLSLPLDLVPDFVPVIGQIDDILVVAVGAGLMLRLTPVKVLEGHIADLEQLGTPLQVIDSPRQAPGPNLRS
jgi:uncharacterized membrane protein YkvA (DUF1232 family)